MKCQMKLLSSLEKVFLEEEPIYRPECNLLTGLWGETISYQVAYTGNPAYKEEVEVVVDSVLQPYIRVRKVEQVPVGRAVNEEVDDYYLKKTSGLYPDLLQDLEEGKVFIFSNQWSSLWVDISLEKEIPEGRYEIEIRLEQGGEVLCSATKRIEVIGVSLPKQRLIHTEWFHADCLADYYKVEVFSETHWELMENFFKEYVLRGCNMMLVPLFTSPLDTAMGGERTTTQLIEVEKIGQDYRFGFEKLKRYIDLCKECGIEYFEMSHLFSQWGAGYAPKIMAKEGEKEEKIFGWHTPAVGEYTKFLEAFLPQLIEQLKKWGIAEVTYFHISDEPREEDLESYRKARQSLGTLLEGFQTFDALSSYEFYRHGLIENPIPGNNEVEEFMSHGFKPKWTYYCTMQSYEVSNRFMSMPSARNRIYGIQLYKYDIEGILHWGYNFYNSQFSLKHINPYRITDAEGGFPAGDAFLVYPGEDGHPEESIRMMVHYQALTDVRALQLLESYAGKEYVLELIEGDLEEPLTFTTYPKSDMYLIALRNRVNREIQRWARKMD